MQLKELHPKLTRAEREAMAAAAGIKPEYLAQLAAGFKRNPPLKLCAALIAHDKRLTFKDLAAEFAEPPAYDPTKPRSATNNPGERNSDKARAQ